MPLAKPLPDVFSWYGRIGGVLDFAQFEHCSGADSSLRETIRSTIEAISGQGTVDRARLERLPWRPLTRESFLGSRADAETDTLRKRGNYTTSRGRELTDPSYEQLESLRRAGEYITTRGR